MALPTPLTDAWIKSAYPALEVTVVSSHELQVQNPKASQFIVRLMLPHQDFEAEALILWPGAKQEFRARGGGHVVESYKWDDEHLEWAVPWEAFVSGWLTALSAPEPRPVRPGKAP